MKKLLHFLVLTVIANTLYAQSCDGNLPILEDFTDSNVVNVCWNLVDSDGDGNDWYWWQYSAYYGGYKCIVSNSYYTSTGALNPDNWITSYAIDLNSVNPGTNIELSWKLRGELAGFAHEYYTVYAATGNQISDFQSSSVKRSEYVDEVGGNGTWTTRTLDLSSLAGNTVYIAFRHHASSNQYNINIDDVSVTTQALSIEDFNDDNFGYYFDHESSTLNLSSTSKPINTVEIFSILGQNIITKRSAQNSETLDLSSLTNGVYIARVTIDGTDKSFKFIKS